jgi:hypothetical protein
MPALSRRTLRTLACALPLLLAACGGGGDDRNAPPVDCSVTGQQTWLRSYMNDWYFWYALAPNPLPDGFDTVDAYFNALLYGGGGLIPNGGGAVWPADRYSGYESTESFNRFFGAGQTLGYGVAVAGIEVTEPTPQPTAPLYIRYIEPLSPAAAAGLVRGERVMSINGADAASVISANDFGALTANAVDDKLTLVVRNADADRTVELLAKVFPLSPVQNAKLLPTPDGRSIGYVMVKDMIDQGTTARADLAQAFDGFKANNVQELVLDLRYNGGGLVTMARTLASYAAGSRGSGQVFARLLYNDKRSAYNEDFSFTNPAAWSGFSKVYVLAGPRTCSASEQVVNGLRGVGVDVVAIGDTTCGKPVGFLPQSDACGTTYSVVNFEGVNARNEGRYFDGFAATCAVAEDFSVPIGATNDSLLVAAAHHADNGACPAGTAVREQPQSRQGAPRKRYNGADGGERTGMSAR